MTESAPGSAATKAYIVSRPARTVTEIVVYATTAAEAVHKADMGFGEAIDSFTTNTGKGTARRAPEYDDAD